MTTQGIDVSHWNGTLDWPRLAADGVQFAYVKATQGTTEDPLFATNTTNAEKAGILTLAYPFVTAGDGDAAIQKFESVVGSMAAVLDCEVAGIAEAVALWVAAMRGRPTLAYAGLYPPFMPPASIWALPRILPEYSAAPRLRAWDGASTPDWQNEWLIWQRSERGTFQGEVGNFDLDVLGIDFDRFKAWCQTGVFPAPISSSPTT